jgi:uncharacterized protein with von Willebrand factor type A (vWA) domain
MDTEQDFRDFMERFGGLFPKGPEDLDDLIELAAAGGRRSRCSEHVGGSGASSRTSWMRSARRPPELGHRQMAGLIR